MFIKIIYDSGSLPHTIFDAQEQTSHPCMIKVIFFKIRSVYYFISFSQ